MNEPMTLTVLAGTTGAVGWWAGIDPWVAIGAFTGAIFYVLSSTDLKLVAKLGFGFVSFVFGIICADWAAELISWVVNVVPGVHSPAPIPLGAFIAAAVAIKLLMAITTKDFSNALLSRLLGWAKAAVVKSDIGGPR